jgi:hypothetical protein
VVVLTAVWQFLAAVRQLFVASPAPLLPDSEAAARGLVEGLALQWVGLVVSTRSGRSGSRPSCTPASASPVTLLVVRLVVLYVIGVPLYAVCYWVAWFLVLAAPCLAVAVVVVGTLVLLPCTSVAASEGTGEDNGFADTGFVVVDCREIVVVVALGKVVVVVANMVVGSTSLAVVALLVVMERRSVVVLSACSCAYLPSDLVVVILVVFAGATESLRVELAIAVLAFAALRWPDGPVGLAMRWSCFLVKDDLEGLLLRSVA